MSKKTKVSKAVQRMCNTVLEQNKPIREIGGYIVHKPEKDSSIGLVFCGWTDDGRDYVFGHDFGVIFKNPGLADELREDLGDGWAIKDVATITDDEFLRMRLKATIFDKELPCDSSWHVFVEAVDNDA